MHRARVAVFCSMVALTAPALSSQGRPGGQGAGRGAPLQGQNDIAGRVTDPDKHPVAGAFVTALRPSASGDRPFTFVSALLHVLTDANGEYRLSGLMADDYFVVVLPKNALGSPRQPLRTGFGQTFFPNASEVKAAVKVRVSNTSTVRADVTLAPARLASVSGVVVGSDDQPAKGGTLEFAHGDHLFGLDSHGYRLAPSGLFNLGSIAPGTYFLVFHESAWPPPRGEIPLISQVKVVVSGDDVSDVKVAPIHMVQASGRVVMDASARASADLSTMTIGASPVDFDGNPGPQKPSTLQADLTFSFKTWPSQGRLRVSPADVWTIKSIRVNGVDVTNSPIAFVKGKDVTGLEVEVVRSRYGRR